MPKNRDELADVYTLLREETRERIGERDQISALGVARARIYKGTAEYQTAEILRQKTGVKSVYEDEKALADRLSEDDAA